ncbi:hypothetical protein MJN85_28760, partial [Salmonella enterica subsp. enterica serovar Anatum]|nr:hypothetical protein [Salmonella enterica subsp. enterica serovar Anatum]
MRHNGINKTAQVFFCIVISVKRGKHNIETDQNRHSRKRNKLAAGSFEARGKKLGIIGYGHIGTQLGILAESLGMHVYFY